MKFTYVTAVALTLTAAPVLAQQTPAEPLYFGLKGGAMDADVGGFDNASNLGAFVGYTLHEDVNGSFFVEGEYTRSFSDGDVAGGGDWDAETLAGYAGYRTAGPWYLKAKAGFAYYDIAVRNAIVAAEGDDTTLSFGAGGGARLNEDTGIEVEYTYLDSDLSFWSLGVFTRF